MIRRLLLQKVIEIGFWKSIKASMYEIRTIKVKVAYIPTQDSTPEQ